MVREALSRERNLDLLSDLESVDEEDAEQLLDQYEAVGDLFSELSHRDFVGEEYPDLGVSVEPGQIYQELYRNGMFGRTGYQEIRPDPPDVYEISGPEMDSKRYEFFGRQDDGSCYFYRIRDDETLEVKVMEQNFEGDLEDQGLEKFAHSPAARLQYFVEGREWDLFREPDYDDLRSVLKDDSSNGEVVDVDPPEITGQSTWNDWKNQF